MAPRTIRTGRLGKVDLKLVDAGGVLHALADEGGRRIVHLLGEEGESADRLWMRLHDEMAKRSVSYFGFEGAKARFLTHFPGGFSDERYIGQGRKTGTGERAYKLKAKERLESAARLEEAAEGKGDVEAVIRAFADTNMLEPIRELPKVGVILRSATGASFLRGAARLTLGDVRGGLSEMEAAARPQEAGKWTIVSYLPFLWRPDEHAFLKPQVTQDFAQHVGHPFAGRYHSELRPEVYESLLDLYAQTRAAIADLQPRDNIDVQSFIWVVGKYPAKSPVTVPT